LFDFGQTIVIFQKAHNYPPYQELGHHVCYKRKLPFEEIDSILQTSSVALCFVATPTSGIA